MPNQLNIGSRNAAPTKSNGGVSTGAIAVFPCRHSTSTTVLANIADPLVTGEAGAAFVPATAFASAEGLLTADAASTDTTMRLSLANFTYSYNNRDTLLIASRIKLAALPGSTKPIWGQGGNNTSTPGWGLKCQSTGVLNYQLDTATTAKYSANTETAGPANDGKLDTNWRHVMFAFWDHSADGTTGKYCIWIDGVPAYAATPKYATSLPSTITPIEALRIGQYYRTTGPVTASIGATQSDFHVYRAPQAVINSQAKMDALAARLFRDPTRPLSAAEWPMT